MRAVLVVVWVWLLAGNAAAQPGAAQLYNEGNARYRQGDFESARDRYLQAVAKGAQDARLYYNLGNACFKARRLGEAILWYERGLRLAPRDSDLRANLRFAGQFKKDREADSGESPVWRSLVGLYLFPTLDELCLGFALLLLLTLGLAAWRLWNPERARGLVLVLILSGGSLLLLEGAFLGARLSRQAGLDEAVVTAEQATARSAPAEDQTAVFVVHEGTKVRVERREGQWVLVRLGSGLGGWLPGAAMEGI